MPTQASAVPVPERPEASERPAVPAGDAVARRRKRLALLGIAVGAGLAVLAWSQTWFELPAEAAKALGIEGALAAAGDTAAPALIALALAALAALAGLALAGRVLCILLGSLVALIGAGALLSALLAIADPIRALLPLVTEATGVSGEASIRARIEAAEVVSTGWPWLAAAAGALLLAVGLFVVVTAGRWPGSARRFETRVVDADSARVPATSTDPVAQWDALSDGEDPTG